MRIALALLAGLVAVALPACDEVHPQIAFAVLPPLPQTYLRYRVHGAGREWTREFVVSRDAFAELREAGGKRYALGLLHDPSGEKAWLRVGEREPVEIEDGLAADERTEAGMIGMRFAEPGAPPELESCRRQVWGDRSPGVCTFVYTPPDGHALWVDAERGTGRPVAFARVAQHDAVESCNDIAWSDEDGATVLASATCSAIVHEVGRQTTTWTLEERRPEPVPPAWARVSPEDVIPLRSLREPVLIPIADPSSRVYVGVEAGGSEPLQLVLDTGSPFTILSRRALRALGVVPSPEPSLHVRPPFLPPDTYDAAIVDRLVIRAARPARRTRPRSRERRAVLGRRGWPARHGRAVAVRHRRRRPREHAAPLASRSVRRRRLVRGAPVLRRLARRGRHRGRGRRRRADALHPRHRRAAERRRRRPRDARSASASRRRRGDATRGRRRVGLRVRGGRRAPRPLRTAAHACGGSRFAGRTCPSSTTTGRSWAWACCGTSAW